LGVREYDVEYDSKPFSEADCVVCGNWPEADRAMPNGSEPQISDHADDDDRDDSDSPAPLVCATILFLVPVSPRQHWTFGFSLPFPVSTRPSEFISSAG
jgi:hypothetical protein